MPYNRYSQSLSELFCKKLFRLELVTLIYVREITRNHNRWRQQRLCDSYVRVRSDVLKTISKRHVGSRTSSNWVYGEHREA